MEKKKEEGSKEKSDKKEEEKEPEERKLSEEEQRKLEELEVYCKRISEVENEGVQLSALQALKNEIVTSTSSVASIPTVLKLVKTFFDGLKDSFERTKTTKNKQIFGDVMSVLAMVWGEDGDVVKYKLHGSDDDLKIWGFEYVRFLSGEIGREYARRDQEAEQRQVEALKDSDIFDLLSLVNKIVPMLIESNHEPFACDLLFEVDKLAEVITLAVPQNYKRICRYLIDFSGYQVPPENMNILQVCYDIYKKNDNIASAMRIAMIMNKMELIQETYKNCSDKSVKRQLAFMLARYGAPFADEDSDDESDSDEMKDDEDEDEEEETEEEILQQILNHEHLSDHFLYLAKELDSVEPKEPKDIYKTHITGSAQRGGQNIKSAKENLASTYVNAFVNCGFCKDKIMTVEKSTWIYHNKDHGKISAAASLGMIYLWNSEEGLNEVDRFTHSKDVYIHGGALLGMGITSTTVRTEEDACFGVLKKYVTKHPRQDRLCAILGLGIAYCGSNHEGCKELLSDILSDSDTEPIDVVCIAGLALGMIFVGGGTDSDNEDLVMSMMSIFQSSVRKILEGSFIPFLCLGMGLLYFGAQEKCEGILTMTVDLDVAVSKLLCMTIDICAYAGTGNEIKVQQLLKIVSEHPMYEKKKREEAKKKKEEEEENLRRTGGSPTPGKKKKKRKEEDKMKDDGEDEEKKEEEDYIDVRYHSVAALGLGLVVMGEHVGVEMVKRIMNHILHYGELSVKKAIPFAFALLHMSDPDLEVMDILSKLSHENNSEISQSAILALGLIGAGTNNSRLGSMLRNLAEYYAKESNHLFLTRVAQGLTFMGKGLVTVSPFLSDRKIMRPISLAGILPIIFAGLDMRHMLLGEYHYMLYCVAPAILPRMLITVDEKKLKPNPVVVRVGQAVDTIGKAGKAKTITGFATHTSPVILQYNERAEVADIESWKPLTQVLEDIVIVKEMKLILEEKKDEKKKKKMEIDEKKKK